MLCDSTPHATRFLRAAAPRRRSLSSTSLCIGLANQKRVTSVAAWRVVDHPIFFSMIPRPPTSPLFPYTTLFRSPWLRIVRRGPAADLHGGCRPAQRDRQDRRLHAPALHPPGRQDLLHDWPADLRNGDQDRADEIGRAHV